MSYLSPQMLPLAEACRNFTKTLKLVDKHGAVYLFHVNKPKYIIVDLEADNSIWMSEDEKIDFVSARLLKKYHEAFEELAK